MAEESGLTKGKTKRCALFVGSCSDRLTSKEMSKKMSEVESSRKKATEHSWGVVRRAGMENKGFGWSSMKYLEGCRIAVSANRQAWTVLWGCSERRAFWKWIGGVWQWIPRQGGSDMRRRRRRQGWAGLRWAECKRNLGTTAAQLWVTCIRDQVVCPGSLYWQLPLGFWVKGRKQGREARS